MILVDTSIWVDHLRSADTALEDLLNEGAVLSHPSVVGEVSLGNLSKREQVIGLMHRLPRATVAHDNEVLLLIEQERLYGAGIGYVDAQLLAATKLTPEALLWSRDKRLRAFAERLGLGFQQTT